MTTDAYGGLGGIAKYNRDFLSALCSYPDCTEVVAIPRLIPKEAGALPSKLTYITLGLKNKLNYVLTVLNVVCRNPRYDLIVCSHINLLPILFFIRFWVRAPSLLLIYGIDAWKPNKSRLVNFLVNNIYTFISISEITKRKFLNWTDLHRNKGLILPNAINISKYSPGPKIVSLQDRYGLAGKTVLMTLGRLSSDERYKGIDEIIELLPELARDIPNLGYLVVGDGTDLSRLQEKARSLGVVEYVVFTGIIPESEKVDHYRLADVFVMPSRSEGFGFVFLEAIACGIPVVASKVDGSREAVRDGKLGILVDPDKPEEIKAGILEALKRHRGIVPKGLDYFSYSNFKKRCHRIIDQVLARSKRGGS